MGNAYWKDIWQTVKKEKKRFLSIAVIATLGVTMMCGLRASCVDLRYSADRFFDEQNLFDVRVLSTLGLTDEDIEALAAIDGVEDVDGGYSETVYTKFDGIQKSIDVRTLSEKGFNMPYLLEGELPEQENEIVITENYKNQTGNGVGDVIVLDDEPEYLKENKFKITGIIVDAMDINSTEGSMGFRSTATTDYVGYVIPEAADNEVYSAVYLSLEGTKELSCYTDEYTEKVESVVETIESKIKKQREQARYDEVYEEAMEEWLDGKQEMEEEFAKADKEIADAREELANGKKELEDARKKIADGYKQIEDGLKQLNSQEKLAKEEFAKAEQDIRDGYAQIDAGKETLEAGYQKLLAGQEQLNAGKAQLTQQQEAANQQFQQAQQQISDKEAELTEGYAQYDAAKARFEAAKPQMEQQIRQLENRLQEVSLELEALDKENLTSEEAAEKQVLEAEKTELESQLATLKGTITSTEQQLAETLTQLDAGKQQLDAGKEQLRQQQEAANQQFTQAWAVIDQNQNELDAGFTQYYAGLADLEAGEAELIAGEKELNAQKAEAYRKIKEGRAELEEGRRELEDGERELADGEKELADGEIELAENVAGYEEEKAKAEKELADAKAEIDDIDMTKWYVQDRTALSGFTNVKGDASSIQAIGDIFPILFLTVAILISLTTITRMVDEERGLIGTYKALGFTNKEIRRKYVLYAAAACLVGGIIGDIGGYIILPVILFRVFHVMYLIPEYMVQFDVVYGLGGILLFEVGILAATFYACGRKLKRMPAVLMRPKTPRAGSRVLLERITLIWKRLSFLNKVTARNIFRYKKRMLMTISGIMGCTALLLCGFTIKNTVSEMIPQQYDIIYKYELMAVTMDEDFEVLNEKMSDDREIQDYIPVRVESMEIYNDAGKKETVQLIVVPEGKSLADYIYLKDKEGQEYSLEDGDVFLTRNATRILSLNIGDEVTWQNQDLEEAKVSITQIVENYLGNAAYMTESTYVEMFETFEENGVLASFSDACKDQEAYTDALARMDEVMSAVSTQQMAAEFDSAFALINMVVYVVLILAAMLAFVVLFTLSNTNISERERELATIKVLGFYDNEVHSYVNKETLILTSLGVLFGMPAGWLLGRYVMGILELPSLEFYIILYKESYAIAAVITIVFAFMVNFITDKTLNKINMIEALKSVE